MSFLFRTSKASRKIRVRQYALSFSIFLAVAFRLEVIASDKPTIDGVASRATDEQMASAECVLRRLPEGVRESVMVAASHYAKNQDEAEFQAALDQDAVIDALTDCLVENSSPEFMSDPHKFTHFVKQSERFLRTIVIAGLGRPEHEDSIKTAVVKVVTNVVNANEEFFKVKTSPPPVITGTVPSVTYEVFDASVTGKVYRCYGLAIRTDRGWASRALSHFIAPTEESDREQFLLWAANDLNNLINRGNLAESLWQAFECEMPSRRIERMVEEGTIK